ncbi:hypothetical protein BU24DRAFT_32450 [Aaosphaeria arxii CBS 175.79]|uniref:Uncharacterized protein n=1 Tax=Aaosphaeria arxii CBS 175.79 TaxID=1450172 RepID=A0A6A5YB38_9PLEO|nr:uncharacterized protein BU24DRAFT_32450 [Aaosphaeria arxii CBS 175.79]KAF2021911.1 hypothetical protein BU24DRAFT_32450 [Aaosphaeria arxii CBS 175.79]
MFSMFYSDLVSNLSAWRRRFFSYYTTFFIFTYSPGVYLFYSLSAFFLPMLLIIFSHSFNITLLSHKTNNNFGSLLPIDLDGNNQRSFFTFGFSDSTLLSSD